MARGRGKGGVTIGGEGEGGGGKKSFLHVAHQNNSGKKCISMEYLAWLLGCGCGQGVWKRGYGC